MNELDRIFMNSEKGKLLEQLTKELETYNKVVVVLIEDKPDKNTYSSLVMTLGLDYNYEAYGILEVGKRQLQDEDN